jgi:hypothetical protein
MVACRVSANQEKAADDILGRKFRLRRQQHDVAESCALSILTSSRC